MPGVTSVGFSAMPLLKGYAWQNAVLGKDFEGAPIEEQPVLSEVGPRQLELVLAGRGRGVADQVHPRAVPAVLELCQGILPGPKSDRAALRARGRHGASQPGH